MWLKVEKYHYISFDIFDTLVRRNVESPKDVFEIVSKQCEYLKPLQYINDFAKIRTQAEHVARNKYCREITLDDIYEEIFLNTNYETLDIYKNKEIEIELAICQPDYQMQKLLNKCIDAGKNVILITDMYLPETVIISILNKCGYYGYKKLYLSNLIGSMKADGKLFEYVLDKEKISPKQLIHIGDNIKSDIHQANKCGISSIYVKRKDLKKRKKQWYQEKKLSLSILNLYISNNNYYKDDIFSNVGFSAFGPLLFGFMEWIHDSIKKKGYEKVYFLSRDGYIMKQAYDSLYGMENIKTFYFYASRRALQGAAIHLNPEFDIVLNSMYIPRSVSLKWLIERWGLDEEMYEDVLENESIDLSDEFDGKTLLYNHKIRSIFEKLKSRIIENSRVEYLNFCKYLEKMEFNEKVAIVDIGWYGNMQNSLQTMLKNMKLAVEIEGYYLGIVPDSKFQKDYKMNGYLFERGKNEDLFYHIKYINTLLELFFMAHHGSAKRYILNNNIGDIELDMFEYKDTETEFNIQLLQDSALEFVEGFRTISCYIKNDEMVYFNNLFDTFSRPDIITATEFGNLMYWDAKWIRIANKESLMKIIIRPKVFVKSYLFASWKMGYLKRMLKINIPYEKIVFSTRKIYKRVK